MNGSGTSTNFINKFNNIKMENYLKNIGASQSIIDWFEKRVKEPCDLSEQEHIADFFLSKDCPKRFERMTYNEAKVATDKWVKKLNKQAKDIKESKKDTEVILDYKDGFKFVKLVGENAYKREGKLMRHCVADYYGKDDEIYSLRDKDNLPHATISKDSQQIKGKGNGSIHPKYIKYVVEFLEHLDINVRDSEMKNLGYVNIEDFEDKNAVFKDLYRDKYFYKENLDNIVDKKGNKYESLSLWGLFGLFDFNSKLEVKFNFSVSKSVETFKASIKGMFSKNKKIQSGGDSAKMSGGNYAKMSGGNSAQMSGGDSAQMSGGDSAQMSGGYYAKMSGGNYAKMSGGNYAQMSGGYYAQMSGGDSAKMSGGNSAQIELKGKNALAIAGKDSQMKGVIGAWIVLTEYDKDYNIIAVESTMIDGEKIKENTWYKLKDKKFIEISESN